MSVKNGYFRGFYSISCINFYNKNYINKWYSIMKRMAILLGLLLLVVLIF